MRCFGYLLIKRFPNLFYSGIIIFNFEIVVIRLNKFTLMNKNKKIFDFLYDDNEHLIVSFDRIYKENEKYAPFGLMKDDCIDKNRFNKWWKNRQIPASRKGLRELLHNSNICDNDNFDLLDSKAYCLSLSDQYWVKNVDEEITWEEINFFDNEFLENSRDKI